MKQQNVIILVVAAIAVVAAVVAIPALTGDDTQANTAPTSADAGGDAPPIGEDAEMPADHPDIGEMEQPQMDDVIQSAEEAYEANPEDVQVVLALANTYVQAGRLDDAEGKYQEALELESGSVEAQAGLAMVKLSNGDVEGALSDLEQLVEANPESQVAWYNLAIARFSADNREGAEEAWQAVADIDPDSELGQMAQQFTTLMESPGSGGENPHGMGGDATGSEQNTEESGN